MNEEDVYKLDNVDPDDISDVLIKVEKSFKIKFGSNELKDVNTFGELCDIIVSKIEAQESNDCTSQQAFYKLREAISRTLEIDKSEIQSKIKLALLFPKPTRRQKIKQVEQSLGFSLKILRPKHSITGFFSILFFISLIALFVSWKIALIGISISMISMTVANQYGNELKVDDIEELVNKISRENYFNSRRNNNTINKTEVFNKVQDLFSHDLGLQTKYLTRQATFS